MIQIGEIIIAEDDGKKYRTVDVAFGHIYTIGLEPIGVDVESGKPVRPHRVFPYSGGWTEYEGSESA